VDSYAQGMLPALTVVLSLAGAFLLRAQSPLRHGPDSPDRGLLVDPAALAPYHSEPGHRLNRIFRLLWTVQMTPTEVAAVLPREGTRIESGWVHEKRAGTDADARWFGGDGRQLPLEDLPTAAVEELAGLLRGLGDDDRAALRNPLALAVLFQNDLLRAAERLQDLERQPELVQWLVRGARFLALDAAELAQLQNPLAPALGDAALRAHLGEQLPPELQGTAKDHREILRRSTRLFDAERTLLWSRVFLAHPDGEAALAAMLPKGDGERRDATEPRGPTVPIGFRAVLVQGLIALGQDGRAHATPIVVDVRTQVLQNRDPLGADNATFTHDGLDFGIWQLERQGLREGRPAAIYRAVAADDQDLFRDYGTAKHTTYRGQCSLCHRVSDTPEPQLAGFPVLRPHVQATFAVTGDERLRLAETQAQRLLDRLLAPR
jgi:DNA-directed RNA polymerase specialized sigma24 family protein